MLNPNQFSEVMSWPTEVIASFNDHVEDITAISMLMDSQEIQIPAILVELFHKSHNRKDSHPVEGGVWNIYTLEICKATLFWVEFSDLTSGPPSEIGGCYIFSGDAEQFLIDFNGYGPLKLIP